jgi:two-component system secretion response regulator SsrB
MQKLAHVSSLNPREREILRLVRQGCRDREIALNLSLPVVAVTSFMEQICEKLDARDRLELAIFADRIDS